MSLQIQHDVFQLSFPDKGFRIRHGLVDSELFKLPRLVDLANSLPYHSIEHNLGDIEVSHHASNPEKNKLSVSDTILQIENCKSWMVLKNVEQDPDYRTLLKSCLDEVDLLSSPIVGDMMKMEAFVFISSPNSVTPFHFDPEHNFLLQIRGNKMMSLFDRSDRDLLPEIWIEERYGDTSRSRYLHLDESSRCKAEENHLAPGDGLFVPQNAPHWVKNGNEVSISFSITFRSKESERLARLYSLNDSLRKLGLNPGEVMKSPYRDLMKDTFYRVYRKFKILFSGT